MNHSDTLLEYDSLQCLQFWSWIRVVRVTRSRSATGYNRFSQALLRGSLAVVEMVAGEGVQGKLLWGMEGRRSGGGGKFVRVKTWRV